MQIYKYEKLKQFKSYKLFAKFRNLRFDPNLFVCLSKNTMLPNYYDYLEIEDICELDDNTRTKIAGMLDKLTKNESLISVASKIETGVYLLGDPYLKESYDYLLEKGWVALLTDTIEFLYLLSVISCKRIETTIRFIFICIKA